MSEDIFVPLSKPQDAIVGPLDTITWLTNNSKDLEDILINGYLMTRNSWIKPKKDEQKILNNYLGLGSNLTWRMTNFYMEGEGANIKIRVIDVDQKLPCIRSSYDGLYHGGATISSPIGNLSNHERIMSQMDVKSTIGIKNMEFSSPSGDVYISSEIVYEGPDNIFMLGVTRPSIFIPIGPMDREKDIGGTAYSARCTTNTDVTLNFFKEVLGYEIRRDVEFEIDDNSAINIPQGIKERFIQGFSPGSSTGYIVLMDHGDDTKTSLIENSQLPGRGIIMWSFKTSKLDLIIERASNFNIKVMSDVEETPNSGFFDKRRIILRDPDGFQIEIIEDNTKEKY